MRRIPLTQILNTSILKAHRVQQLMEEVRQREFPLILVELVDYTYNHNSQFLKGALRLDHDWTKEVNHDLLELASRECHLSRSGDSSDKTPRDVLLKFATRCKVLLPKNIANALA